MRHTYTSGIRINPVFTGTLLDSYRAIVCMSDTNSSVIQLLDSTMLDSENNMHSLIVHIDHYQRLYSNADIGWSFSLYPMLGILEKGEKYTGILEVLNRDYALRIKFKAFLSWVMLDFHSTQDIPKYTGVSFHHRYFDIHSFILQYLLDVEAAAFKGTSEVIVGVNDIAYSYFAQSGSPLDSMLFNAVSAALSSLEANGWVDKWIVAPHRQSYRLRGIDREIFSDV